MDYLQTKFEQQIEKNRIKTLSQDYSGDLSCVRHTWDPYMILDHELLRDNFWDITKVPLKQFDEIYVRMRDTTSFEGIIGQFNLLTGYAKVAPDGTSRCKLIRYEIGQKYVARHFPKVDTSKTTSNNIELTPNGVVKAVYAILDGTLTSGFTVTIKKDSTTYGTFAFAAGDSYGTAKEAKITGEGTTVSSITVNLPATAAEKGNFGITAIAVYE